MKRSPTIDTAIPCSVALLALTAVILRYPPEAGMLQWLIGALLANLLGVAVYTDLRSHRIRNSLTYSTIASAVLLIMLTAWLPEQVVMPGATVTSRLLGALLCGTVTLVAWSCRAIGGGDVKLVAALGLLLGAQGAFWATLTAHLLAAGYIVCLVLLPRLLHHITVLPRLVGRIPKLNTPTLHAKTRLPMAGFYAAAVLLLISSKYLKG